MLIQRRELGPNRALARTVNVAPNKMENDKLNVYSVSQKKVAPPKTFCNIFTLVKNISVIFCQYVASLYLHILTNFGRFILIFNKMALIFLEVPIVFNVFSFKVHQVRSP